MFSLQLLPPLHPHLLNKVDTHTDNSLLLLLSRVKYDEYDQEEYTRSNKTKNTPSTPSPVASVIPHVNSSDPDRTPFWK